jgi:DtxR family transcriptional regulator, Mn-dependent transcriptional regulator
MLSFTEENYLKIIYLKLEQTNGQEVNTNDLALHTNTKAASVTDMLKKLAEKELIHYKKYQGVTLSEIGEKIALKVIRKHRLWEYFLVESLGFGWDEVHQIAEQLEHIDSEKLTERLAIFLKNPQFDPHGDPIPDADGILPNRIQYKLSEIKPNTTATMTGVTVHTPSFLRLLDQSSIALGTSIKVLTINEFDHSFELLINESKQVFISHEVAKNILVK